MKTDWDPWANPRYRAVMVQTASADATATTSTLPVADEAAGILTGEGEK